MSKLVWKSVISLTSYFQDICQTAKPIPDCLQTFPGLTLTPDISGRRGNPVKYTRSENIFCIMQQENVSGP